MTQTPKKWLCPEWLFVEDRLQSGLAIGLADGRVVEMRSAAEISDGVALTGIVAPGLLDIQVNGGGGVLLNAEPSAQAMIRMAAAHRAQGTGAIFPTLISDEPQVMDAAVSAAIETRGAREIAGIHLEGPHLDPRRRGTHQGRFMRPVDARTLRAIESLRGADIPVLVTLAPEMATSDDIRALCEMGAVVSLGHSGCDFDTAMAAFDAGASAVTHLFNAMAPLHHRAPGLAGAALSRGVAAGLICDGHHVHDAMCAMALRASPRIFLVSDAMPTLGGPSHFSLQGDEITVQDGCLVNCEGNLAGAHLALSWAAKRACHVLGFGPERALRAALTEPAKLMGLDHLTRLEGRARSDLVRFSENLDYLGPL